MYIKDSYRLLNGYFLHKINKETCFFAKFTFSARMRHMEKMFFSNITYKEGKFYQQQSELDFRCESGRKGENRYSNWHHI